MAYIELTCRHLFQYKYRFNDQLTRDDSVFIALMHVLLSNIYDLMKYVDLT